MNKRVKDPGLGINSQGKAERYISQEGNFNVKHVNKKFTLNEAYTYLLTISWPRFFIILYVFFTVVNYLFAFIYVIIGVEDLGITKINFLVDLLNASYFSTQTLTTLGYGFYAPKGLLTGFVSSIEAIIGLIIFAFITGLLYGRFSKPKSNIRFSKSLVLNTHNNQRAIMFKLMNRRKSMVILPKISASLALKTTDRDGNSKNNFYSLKLEREKITYLPTTWTIVHYLNEDSPLYSYSNDQLNKLKAEILILFSYQDDSFNQELHQPHSFILENLQVGFKFKKSFYFNDEGQLILDHDLFDELENENLCNIN